jgi:hypothetical protein
MRQFSAKACRSALLILLFCGCAVFKDPDFYRQMNENNQQHSGPSAQDQVLERQRENNRINEEARQRQQTQHQIKESRGSWIYNSYTSQNQYVPPGAHTRWDDANKTWIIQP